MKKIKLSNNKNKEKIKKTERKSKNNVIQMKKPISKLMLLVIGIAGIILFLLSYFGFGFIIALLITFMYLIVMLLTQVLDRNSKNSKKRKWVKAISIIALAGGIIAIVGFIAFFTYIVIKAPDLNVEKLERKETTLILDNKGETYATLGTEKREKVSYKDLPEVFIDALIATEDSRFFQHNGLDGARFLVASVKQAMGEIGRAHV